MHPVIPIILAISVAGGFGFVAHDQGYIPMTEMMVVDEPIGYKEINLETYEIQYRDLIKDIPNLDKINYKGYESDYNQHEIYVDYKQRLEQQGYNEETVGKTTIEGNSVFYAGYLKGMTVVLIAITSGENVGRSTESVVLYTKGALWDYQEIYDYYK